MKTNRTHTFVAAGVFCIALFPATLIYAADELPSWRDGMNKQAVVEFVKRVTTPGHRLCP